jgi:5'-3' exonuclease
MEDVFGTGKTLIVDGDIAIYKPLCVFDEDHDVMRTKSINMIKQQLTERMLDAGCSDYIFCLTGKENFRDFLVDDYKFNRIGKPRPVNLAWAKAWAMEHLDGKLVVGIEADDLMGILAKENTVLWSVDKDIRQIPGQHLDEGTRQIVTVTEEGELIDGEEIKFSGQLGFYYQLLIGDTADYIVGCGNRVSRVYKSGAKKGQPYVARSGVGPKKAYKALMTSKDPLQTVIDFYRLTFKDKWQEKLETQAGLLYMGRELEGNWLRQWTVDGRDQWINVITGAMFYGPNRG